MSSTEASEVGRKNHIFCPLLLQVFWGKVWNMANISSLLFQIFTPAYWNTFMPGYWDVEIWQEGDGYMSIEIGRQRKQQQAISEARSHLDCAAECLNDVLLSADLYYATHEWEWQAGPDGAGNVQASHALRDAVQKLRMFELPDLEGLG